MDLEAVYVFTLSKKGAAMRVTEGSSEVRPNRSIRRLVLSYGVSDWSPWKSFKEKVSSTPSMLDTKTTLPPL